MFETKYFDYNVFMLLFFYYSIQMEKGINGIPDTVVKEWFCASDAESLKNALSRSSKESGKYKLFTRLFLFCRDR